MQSKSFGTNWVIFFLKKDKVGQLLLFMAFIVMAIWLLVARDSLTLGLVVGSLFIFTALFSLLNFLTLGRYRAIAEQRFYDAIYSDCDFQSPYQGRGDMRNIKITWKGIKVSRVTVTALSSSRAAKSPTAWRSIKTSINDSFKLTGDKVVALLGNQHAGKLDFVAGTDSQFETEGEYSSLVLEESLHAFIYETLNTAYGVPLPRLHGLVVGLGEKNQPWLKKMQVDTVTTPSSFNKKEFETIFRQRYGSGNQMWNFIWNSLGVTVESVERGSQKEKILLANASINDLIESSVSTAFNKYGSEAYLLSPDMIEWSADGSHVQSVRIDFLQNDISRPDRIERFEELVTQGMHQLFRGTLYEYIWNVNAFAKTVTIRTAY